LRLEVFLSPKVELIINTWWSTLSQDEAKKFVKDFALYLYDFIQKKEQKTTQNIFPTKKEEKEESSGGGVPLLSDEDIIRNFVALIEEGRADKAALMKKIKDDTEFQTWAVHFAAINSFKLLKIEKVSEESWSNNKHIYKVVLDVWMDPKSANAPIPYYGWQNGENTRWITLEKVENVWKIAEIATGP